MNKTEWLKYANLAALPNGSAGDTPLRPFLWRLMRGENLSQSEAAEFMRQLLDKDRTNVEQIAATLTALAIKGETAEELAGMAQIMHERAERFPVRKTKIADIGGTGASPTKTFNVSTAAAFVAAGAGLSIVKHSNRRVASLSGSTEVLEALRVRLNYKIGDGGEAKSRETAATAFDGAGIAFLSAAAFHGAVNRVANVRHKLGLRTTLNLLGVLTNPARPAFQVVGVWHTSLLQPMAEALNLLGVKRAWVVHGADGLDEITIARETLVAEVNNSKITTFTIEPEDFGIQRAPLDGLKTETPAQSAALIAEVLSGKRHDAARSLVVLNAAAALFISGTAKNEMYAARLAEQSIDSDSARVKLERLIMATNK